MRGPGDFSLRGNWRAEGRGGSSLSPSSLLTLTSCVNDTVTACMFSVVIVHLTTTLAWAAHRYRAISVRMREISQSSTVTDIV